MRFAQAGMNVVLADVEAPRLEQALEDVRAIGVEAIAVRTDVRDAAQVDALAAESIGRFGRVNVVCNNAGVAGTLSGMDIALEEWHWVVDVNLWGVIHGHRSFLPHLMAHGEGHIVNTASMAGHFPGHSAYGATKWAVVGITEGLYQNLRQTGSTVGVSCLCPGWIRTDIVSSHRNRPEMAGLNLETTPEQEAARAWVQAQIDGGLEPTHVAQLVHDAIVGDKFWIFTHDDMVAALAGRHASVLSGENPPTFTLRD